MDLKLTGLVLRNVPVADNKSIITLLTKERGKTVMTCHGARKLTSRNMAPTRLFALSEYIVSEKNGRLTLKESALLESFFDLSLSLEASALGGYILEAGGFCARENEDESALLSLMLNCLYALCKTDLPKEQIKAVFELRLLSEMGCAPSVRFCTCCGEELSFPAFYSAAEGGGVCPDCKSKGEAQGPFYRLDQGTGQAIDYILSCSDKQIFSFKLSKKGLLTMGRLSEESLLYSLERSFDSLKFYNETKNENDE